jgi:hypothetical protein
MLNPNVKKTKNEYVAIKDVKVKLEDKFVILNKMHNLKCKRIQNAKSKSKVKGI